MANKSSGSRTRVFFSQECPRLSATSYSLLTYWTSYKKSLTLIQKKKQKRMGYSISLKWCLLFTSCNYIGKIHCISNNTLYSSININLILTLCKFLFIIFLPLLGPSISVRCCHVLFDSWFFII